MKNMRGSFTLEAAYIMPLILSVMLSVITMGISLHEEVKQRVEAQEKQESIDAVKAIYRAEWLKELLEE